MLIPFWGRYCWLPIYRSFPSLFFWAARAHPLSQRLKQWPAPFPSHLFQLEHGPMTQSQPMGHEQSLPRSFWERFLPPVRESHGRNMPLLHRDRKQPRWVIDQSLEPPSSGLLRKEHPHLYFWSRLGLAFVLLAAQSMLTDTLSSLSHCLPPAREVSSLATFLSQSTSHFGKLFWKPPASTCHHCPSK